MSEELNNNNFPKTGSSILFRQHKTLGFISNHVPAVTRYMRRRKDTLIATCIGRRFQLFTASHFRVVHVGSIHPGEITALAIDHKFIYTACNANIYAWQAGKYIRRTYRGHNNRIHTLQPFGYHLISIDDDNILKVWDVYSGEVYLEIPFLKDDFTITALTHPPTYVNKIVLGSKQGFLQLWNLKTNRLIYKFPGYKSEIKCMEPSPVLDIIGIGHKNGTIILLNLKFNEEIARFKQDCGCVMNISFRTDGIPYLISSSSDGSLVFWNLDTRQATGQIQAHQSPVTTTICFPTEPVLLTTSPDNSMKLWIFDMPDNGCRMLRCRDGHTAPPLCIRYHGNEGITILSAGEDSSLRVLNVLSDSLNKSLGIASYNRKVSKKKNRFELDSMRMPPIVEFTAETTREKEWDNIAAIHAGIIQTTTWSFHKCRMGEHRLVPEKFQNKNRVDYEAQTTCVILTHCGNFIIIGYSTGEVERFNIQSGIHRASYGDSRAHNTAVRGIASDNLNQVVVSGCIEGILKFWPFKGNVKTPLVIMKLNNGISLMRIHRESNMLALALDNFAIYIIDLDTRVIFRRFFGHCAKINDMTFSPDSRWLITTAMDSTIKIWDIPSSYMIDHFRMDQPCISLTMSPNGDFLATAHVNYRGIYLWANKTLFDHVSLRPIDPYSDALEIDLPSGGNPNEEDSVKTMTDLSEKIEKFNIGTSSEIDLINAKYESPQQLSKMLITLSGMPESRWHNLLDWENIQRRNKPKSKLKIPKQAPFFLPTVGGQDLIFDLKSQQNETSDKQIITNFDNLTIFGKMLEEAANSNNYKECIDFLKRLGPTMIDYEIKLLLPIAEGSSQLAIQFLKMIEYMLSTKLDFELAQAWLSVYLRAHNLKLTEYPDIVKALKSITELQEENWRKLETKFMYGMGVVGSLRNFI